jgi:hypothetical protein
MAHRTPRLISRFVSAAVVSVALGLSLYPSIARAYSARTDVVIDRLSDETFDAMRQRAEVIARAAAQRSFDRDVLISDVAVNIVARHNGAELPIMTLGVSRLNWQNRPDVRRWATYYRSSQVLLQLPSQGDLPIPNRGVEPFGGTAAPSAEPFVPAPAPNAVPLPIDTPGLPQTSPVPQSSPAAAPPKSSDAVTKASEAAKEAAKKTKPASKQAKPVSNPTPAPIR